MVKIVTLFFFSEHQKQLDGPPDRRPTVINNNNDDNHPSNNLSAKDMMSPPRKVPRRILFPGLCKAPHDHSIDAEALSSRATGGIRPPTFHGRSRRGRTAAHEDPYDDEGGGEEDEGSRCEGGAPSRGHHGCRRGLIHTAYKNGVAFGVNAPLLSKFVRPLRGKGS